MKKIKSILMLVVLFVGLMVSQVSAMPVPTTPTPYISTYVPEFVRFLNSYPNSANYINQVKKVTYSNYWRDGTGYAISGYEFVRNDADKTITVYYEYDATSFSEDYPEEDIPREIKEVWFLDENDMVSGIMVRGYTGQSHYVYYEGDSVIVYEGWQGGSEYKIKKDGSYTHGMESYEPLKRDLLNYDNLGRAIYSKEVTANNATSGGYYEIQIEYYDSPNNTQLPQNKGYSISAYPGSGYANISDNDGTGTRFEFVIETSRDIDENEIAIRADKLNHTEWHYITPEYFEDFDYGNDAFTGLKRWSFYLHINNPNNSDDKRVIELVLNGQPTGITTTLNVMPQQGSFSPTPQQGEIDVTVNGNYVNFDVQPQIINDRTMVPLRAIFEALDAEVSWDGETQTVYAQRRWEGTGYMWVEFVIGSNIMKNSFGSGVHVIDSPPIIIDGRTLIPVRAAAEAFGFNVDWDETTKTVSIYE